MAFFAKLKSLAKSNWTFVALVILPVLRFLWRLFVGKSSSSSTSPKTPIGDSYKRGDVIDVEVKEAKKE